MKVRSKENIQALLQKHRIEKVLVVGEHNELKGLITVTDFRKAESYPSSCKDDLRQLTRGRCRRYRCEKHQAV